MSKLVELKQIVTFEAARYLPELPASHPCRRLHGHSFKVTLIFRGEINSKVGWLVDYHEIRARFSELHEQLDHNELNKVPGLENPTTENICIWIFERAQKIFPQLFRVSVSETPDTECSYPA
jgi:6-pyruvoyltetrahydropterin/6-carboxytetrahydropterin synthase